MATRGCVQCGTVFTPRREHARFCSPGCRVAWNRDHSTDAAAEERALEWSLTGMRHVMERLAVDHPADEPAAFGAVAEAVWWVTIIDARMIRQYMDIYDAVLAAHTAGQQAMIEGTLAGLRFVRNQLSDDTLRPGFIEPPAAVNGRGTVTAAWQWKHVPGPELNELPAPMRSWEMTRFRAYEQWLAGKSVSLVFHRAAGFLNLAASRSTSGALSSQR
jgi:hypothetical protein